LVEFVKNFIKDLGLQKEVEDAYPYAVVRGSWEGSLQSPLVTNNNYITLLSHVVPHGNQLKILFLRVWTQETTGAIFDIVQTSPTAAGQTGTVEAYPVVGSAPDGVVDYPMLEAPGAEMAHGSLRDPIHVLEGSINFNLLGPTPVPATGNKFSLVWWGVEKTSPPGAN
jgi:hypothetical protein